MDLFFTCFGGQKFQMSTWICILFFTTFREIYAFEVQTTQPIVLAIYGRPVVLDCSFTPGISSTDESLVVTWQRVEDSQVVHSFYYGTDQLDLQSKDYRNRTALFHSKLAEGNASLRLDGVRLEDQGRYLCSINNVAGTGKAEVQVKYAAFYTEPRLTVQCCSFNITFLYETEGYPEPEVKWLNPDDQLLSHNLSVTESSRAPGYLLYLRTQLVVQAAVPVNYTFTLRNTVLEQVIERPVSYVSTLPCGGIKDVCPRDRTALLILLSAVISVILLVGLYLTCKYYYLPTKSTSPTKQNGINLCSEENL